jgi:SpoVK/Ycf46/Vps4 family AAA+-type ATPase
MLYGSGRYDMVEFMAHWDGLLSKYIDSVLVLAKTDIPFDLDEAIIRWCKRRIMVALPNAENRERTHQ